MPAQSSVIRVAIVALAGSCIEWFDFFIYGIATALVFPALFFPASMPPFIGQLAAFSTFSVGFIARPVGGVVFGHFGDRVGRKSALVAALLIMGAATALIGVLPGYATIGWTAPILLFVLRFLQGFAVGGQWGGAVLLATESAPKSSRGLYGSFAQIGVPVGVVAANAVYLLVSETLAPAAFASWGWRIPFLVSVALILLGLYVQTHLEETPAFKELRAKGEQSAPRKGSPILEALKRHPKEIALAACAFLACNGTFYIFITYVIAYGTKALGINQSVILTAILIGSVIMIPALLVCAMFSDRFGRKGIFVVGAAATGLWSYFGFFPLVEMKTLASVTMAVTGGLVAISLMYGPQAAFFAETFDTSVRYSGASLGYQIGAIFGGAMAPLVATALFAEYHSTREIALYMAGLCAISFVAGLLMKDHYKLDLNEFRLQKSAAQAPG